jgi:hypothetical protein
MTARITVTNLSDVLAGFQATEDKIELAVQYAIAQTGLAVERQARINASGRPGPNVQTGNLRRSITTSAVNKGFDGKYEVEVSATMVYARAVEMGLGPNKRNKGWPPGVKYPYLGPAASNLQSNGTLARVFTTNLASRLRG